MLYVQPSKHPVRRTRPSEAYGQDKSSEPERLQGFFRQPPAGVDQYQHNRLVNYFSS